MIDGFREEIDCQTGLPETSHRISYSLLAIPPTYQSFCHSGVTLVHNYLSPCLTVSESRAVLFVFNSFIFCVVPDTKQILSRKQPKIELPQTKSHTPAWAGKRWRALTVGTHRAAQAIRGLLE